MGLISLALLPARVTMASVEVILAAGRLASGEGPLRRPGGYGERLAVLLEPDGAVERLGRLGDPEGPLSRLVERIPGRRARSG